MRRRHYCEGVMLRDFGFKEIHDLVGGYKAWRAAGQQEALPMDYAQTQPWLNPSTQSSHS